MSKFDKFVLENWPLILTGLACVLIVKIVQNVMKDNTNKMSINGLLEKGRRSSTEKNSDEGLDSSDSDLEENDCTSAIHSALPENLNHIPYKFTKLSHEESLTRAKDFYTHMNKRRTIRHFSKEAVPAEVIHYVIKTAGTAPSGAHTEPWTYVVVSGSEIKQKIREIVEEEEFVNYKRRMGIQWTTDLKPLKTNWVKEYLTDAPYLILLFKQLYSFKEDGTKKIHYYNEMSVSIAAGFLLAAIHNAGLVSLTSTPLNCGPALRTLLGRPNSEKLTLLLPVGYPSENALVPDLHRKPLEEIMVEI